MHMISNTSDSDITIHLLTYSSLTSLKTKDEQLNEFISSQRNSFLPSSIFLYFAFLVILRDKLQEMEAEVQENFPTFAMETNSASQ